MIKVEFKKFYAEQNNLNEEDVSREVDIFLDTMKEMFANSSKIVFRNFGTFEVKETKERLICDPHGTGEKIKAKPRKYVRFKISKNKEEVLYVKNKKENS